MAKNTDQPEPQTPPPSVTPTQRPSAPANNAGGPTTLVHTKDGRRHVVTTSHRGEITKLKAMGYRVQR